MSAVEKDGGFIVTFIYEDKPGGVVVHMVSKTKACVIANVDKVYLFQKKKVEGERDA